MITVPICRLIVEYLEYLDILNLSLVNRNFNKAATYNQLWRRETISKFLNEEKKVLIENRNAIDVDWKTMFKKGVLLQNQ